MVKLNVALGIKGTPVFKSHEESERWWSKFYKKIRPKLDKYERMQVRLWPKRKD